MIDETAMTNSTKSSKADIEWENRTLCSDEACIGVIGADGRCKECGKPYEGEFNPSWSAQDESDEELETADAPEAFPDDSADGDEDLEWENRTLCVDESCIGVIGPDGRCKECGKTLDDKVD